MIPFPSTQMEGCVSLLVLHLCIDICPSATQQVHHVGVGFRCVAVLGRMQQRCVSLIVDRIDGYVVRYQIICCFDILFACDMVQRSVPRTSRCIKSLRGGMLKEFCGIEKGRCRVIITCTDDQRSVSLRCTVRSPRTHLDEEFHHLRMRLVTRCEGKEVRED